MDKEKRKETIQGLKYMIVFLEDHPNFPLPSVSFSTLDIWLELCERHMESTWYAKGRGIAFRPSAGGRRHLGRMFYTKEGTIIYCPFKLAGSDLTALKLEYT